MGFLVSLLVLSFLIFFHELGHFLAARFFGVAVERFSIGFGPVLAKKWCCGTEWAISAIPLGGYVKMKGQDDTDPTAKSSDPDSYTMKKPWQRIIILFAGPFANFFLAFLLYLYIALSGYDVLAPKVGQVLPDSPASKAHLQKGDMILAINGQKIKTWEDLSSIIAHSHSPLKLLIDRNGKKEIVILQPKIMKTKNIFGEEVQRPMIGIAPANAYIKVHYSFFEAIQVAYDKTIEAGKFILLGIEKMIEGVVSPKEIGGVLTIMDVTAKASQAGLVALLSFTALISVNLGILNLLPIPALDGGHIMINLYEMITKHAPSEEMLYKITLAGWIFLIGLMGLGLYNDINRLLGVYSG
ncbi:MULTISPECIES: RIP metalloprotease RseP [unclassified Nitratiruptor]|uniref:RIP metalloprotease RseP n=1 Tax=unclassified Nitratiruptor TaxID=2624044 RepID=UPI0019155D48|nr:MULTISPECIES: RIP metalloprotease RseP [unclassified Nitratiruptor]BCD59999.1 regulator of sigma E protease [Nitratiruptor sp. YY08-10]BCD63922.1 regulator of sigma E protease [Nitratiruptor sp. YY08-14]